MKVKIEYKLIPIPVVQRKGASTDSSMEITLDETEVMKSVKSTKDIPSQEMEVTLGEGFFEGCYSIPDIRLAFETLCEMQITEKNAPVTPFVVGIQYLE